MFQLFRLTGQLVDAFTQSEWLLLTALISNSVMFEIGRAHV